MSTYLSLLTAIVSLILTLPQAQAQSPLIRKNYDKQGKTSAKLTALFNKIPQTGYMPIRLEVKNNQNSEKSWTIKCVSRNENSFYYRRNDENGGIESEFHYTCPAKSSKTFDFYVPVITAIPYSGSDTASSNLRITLSSSGSQNETETIAGSQVIDRPSVLLSSSLYTAQSSRLDSLLPSSGYSRTTAEYASSFIPTQLPNDWKGYAGYDALVCTDNEWRAMEKSVQLAILEWNRLGGHLLILTQDPSSNFKNLHISDDAPSGKKLQRSFGSVSLLPIGSINDASLATSIDSNLRSRSTQRLNAIVNDITHNATNTWQLQESLGTLSFNPFFLILILIGFGILVGPVNLFVFAKSGQRHKLFITTPIIAAGATILILLLIIIQDGFGGHGKRIQLIELRSDNGENKAYVQQEQIARTGIILGHSFETSSPCTISPVPLIQSHFARVTHENQGNSSNYIANHGDKGLVCEGDWFQSRSVHGHYLESVIPSRARITLKSSAPSPTITSSFNFPLKSLIFRDKQGLFWQATDIKPGESVKLSKINHDEALKRITALSDSMSPRLQRNLLKLWSRNGHFVATTEQAPAIDTLDSIKWTQTTSVILGPVMTK